MTAYSLTDSGLKKRISDTDRNIAFGNKAGLNIADGGGLTLQRQPSGVWTWFYRYRFHGKASRLSLGSYPAVTLSAAREAHKEIKAMLAKGLNPAQEIKSVNCCK